MSPLEVIFEILLSKVFLSLARIRGNSKAAHVEGSNVHRAKHKSRIRKQQNSNNEKFTIMKMYKASTKKDLTVETKLLLSSEMLLKLKPLLKIDFF